jgi:hypothetical protein
LRELISKKKLRLTVLDFLERISAKPNKKLARAIEICHCGFMLVLLLAGCTIGLTGLISAVVALTGCILIVLSNYVCGCCPVEFLERRLKREDLRPKVEAYKGIE